MNRRDLETKQPHRDLLESQLMAAYDAQGIPRTARRRRWVRFAPAMAAILTLVTASQVPASYPVTVGKRITVELSGGEPSQSASKALARAVGGDSALPRTFSIQLRRMHEGPAILIATVWGDALLPDAAIRERLNAIPEFANAPISIVPMEGKIEDNVAGLLRHHLFRAASKPEAREQARQVLIERLRRIEGSDAAIDVQFEDNDREENVRVKILKER